MPAFVERSMRVPHPLVSGIVVACLPLAACAASPHARHAATADPSKTAASATAVAAIAPSQRLDLVPKVLRRIAREETELVNGSKAMAAELRDPHGRDRATSEANELARELSVLLSLLGTGDEVASDVLDDVANRLQLLDTRVTLLHEKLRIATERTTAVLTE